MASSDVVTSNGVSKIREHAEEGELAAGSHAEPHQTEHLARNRIGRRIRLVAGDGVAGDLFEESGELRVTGDHDLPLEPLAEMGAPLAEVSRSGDPGRGGESPRAAG
jgi:hypothetical protein